MLLGEYEHTIDDKNRLTLPARFRQSFAEGVVVSRGIDACLDVYTRQAWEATMASRLADLDPFTREARQLRRALFSSGSEADLDKQGRVTIPAGLLKKASLTRDVVVVGVGDHLEVWDRKAWQDEIEDVEGRVELVAERVAARER
jgi:transcriptional regulator MraZ